MSSEICATKKCCRLGTHFFIPDHLKTQEICDKVVTRNPRMLDYIPDKFKTQEM